ncbi:MAG: hypothetical protein Q9190_004365 [Brigantiaea leucoxantha]
MKFAKTHYMELKKAKAASWNGRYDDQTAIALAEYENLEEGDPDEEDDRQTRHVELSERHFAMVAEASQDFDNYLRSTLGGQTDADVARLEQTRVDDFHHLVESWEREQKSRDSKGRRRSGRGQGQLDSEDSELADSEDSECSDDESGGSEESEDMPPPRPPPTVKPVKAKGEKKARKKSGN